MNTIRPRKDFATLKKAREYEVPFERMMSPDMVINFLTVYNSLDMLLNSTDEKARGLVFALQAGVTEFNLMNSPPKGIGRVQQQLIQYLASIKALTPECVAACIAYANTTRRPWKDSTKNDFEADKGIINRKPVTVEQGYCKLVLTADAEEVHNPQIYKRITFSDGNFEDVRVAGFRNVHKVKTELEKPYRVECRAYANMYVDDAYGVVS
jgi:hypothetical protein